MIRESLAREFEHTDAWPKGSVGEKVGHLLGAIRGGPPDLASNPKYLDDFGKWRRK